MRIGFDVSQTAEDKAGCGFFADQIIRTLAEIDTANEYLLYPAFYKYFNPDIHKVTQPEAVNSRVYFRGMTFMEMVSGWNTKMVNRSQWLGSPDIVHSNSFTCVKDHDAKIVFTVYDVLPLLHPELPR